MTFSPARFGKTALVTGASSGIGEAFARALAQAGCNVIVVARRSERLHALKAELESAHSICVYPVVADLEAREGAGSVAAEVERLGLEVDTLVNNAGYGVLGDFGATPLDRELGMVDLNCRAVVELTYRFLPGMKVRGRGAVIIVSSIAGAIPVPWFSTYAATKAFDVHFAESLAGELVGTGVVATAVLPGLTRTEFQAIAGMSTRSYHSPTREPRQVVETALRAIERGTPSAVDGFFNWSMTASTRIAPRRILVALSRWVMAKETGR
jgi:short-subunit dehydrogenase